MLNGNTSTQERSTQPTTTTAPPTSHLDCTLGRRALPRDLCGLDFAIRVTFGKRDHAIAPAKYREELASDSSYTIVPSWVPTESVRTTPYLSLIATHFLRFELPGLEGSETTLSRGTPCETLPSSSALSPGGAIRYSPKTIITMPNMKSGHCVTHRAK